jgi:hypothetical protein
MKGEALDVAGLDQAHAEALDCLRKSRETFFLFCLDEQGRAQVLAAVPPPYARALLERVQRFTAKMLEQPDL